MSWNLAFSLLLVVGLASSGDVSATEPAGDVAAEQTPTEKPVEKQAETPAETPAFDGPKRISGMSILGNQEAPTSLVIVPWKSSEIGNSLGIQAMLDDSRQPVDRDVFLRALSYYEIRSETTP